MAVVLVAMEAVVISSANKPAIGDATLPAKGDKLVETMPEVISSGVSRARDTLTFRIRWCSGNIETV